MKVNEFPVLETNRLVLREIRINDAEAIYDYLSDSEVIKYLEGSTDSIEEAKGYISCISEGYEKRTDIRWGIELKENNTLIGDCGLGHINEPKTPTELGYILSKKYWNKGYMSEALKAILEYGFEELRLHRIQGWTHPDNIISSRLLLNNGFTKEGLHREFVYVWHKGIYIDVDMYAILSQDFKSNL
ncbi:MAG TPA: GNAT family N-acetyltransferase [Lachnospiraceae bacterium]|nr:GNAT family N-acetyltransferase [Lachnospiraceae bacterium]